MSEIKYKNIQVAIIGWKRGGLLEFADRTHACLIQYVYSMTLSNHVTQL